MSYSSGSMYFQFRFNILIWENFRRLFSLNVNFSSFLSRFTSLFSFISVLFGNFYFFGGKMYLLAPSLRCLESTSSGSSINTSSSVNILNKQSNHSLSISNALQWFRGKYSYTINWVVSSTRIILFLKSVKINF